MDKRLNLLGLAKRAARLTVGFDAALTAVKDGSAALIVFAADLSEKTLKEWRFATANHTVPMQTVPCSKREIGAALGAGREVGIVAVCDEGFAAAIQRADRTQKEE